MLRIKDVRAIKDDVVQMYESGLSTTEIGRRIGAWPRTVYDVLTETGIAVRSRSDAKKLIFIKGDSPGRYRRIGREIKEQICENCGSLDNLCIHHNDRDRSNNVDENLTILCRSCHTTLHYDLGHLGLPPRGSTVTPEYKKDYMKKWRAEHKESISEYNRQYRLAHLEQRREDGKRYRESKKMALAGEVIK